VRITTAHGEGPCLSIVVIDDIALIQAGLPMTIFWGFESEPRVGMRVVFEGVTLELYETWNPDPKPWIGEAPAWGFNARGVRQ